MPIASDSDRLLEADSTTVGVIAESRKFAIRRVRTASLIGILAPAFEYGIWVSHAIRDVNALAADAQAEPELYSEVYSAVVASFIKMLLFHGAELIGALAAGWWLAYPVFSVVSRFVQRAVFPRVPEMEWQVASDNALWPLPYAATCGVITWIAYAHVFPYGWPNDIVCGTIGHMLGAWCYLTVFVSWFKVARSSRKTGTVGGH